MRFCTNCGQPAEGANFCGSCGARLASTGETSQGHGVSSAAVPGAPPAPAAGGVSPARTTPGALAGVPRLDFVRDLVAATLLLVALALPWDLAHDAHDHVVIILITLVSLASLSLLYLPPLGVLPPTWTAANTVVARLVMNAPYAVAVLVALILDATTTPGGNGVGLAATFGLAGAVLAGMPRETELSDSSARGDYGGHALRAVLILGLVPAGIALLSVIVGAANELFTFLTPAAIISVLVLLAIGPVMIALPAVGTGRTGDPSWRLVLVGMGSVLTIVLLWTGNDDDSSLTAGGRFAESIHGFAMGIALWLVPAAVAASASAGRAMAQVPQHRIWINTAMRLFTVAAVVNAMLFVVVLILLADIESARGELGGTAAVMLVTLAAALIARAALAREHDPQARTVALLVCAGYAVIGTIALAINLDVLGRQGVDLFTLLVTFGYPAIIALTLTAPPSVRSHYATLAGQTR